MTNQDSTRASAEEAIAVMSGLSVWLKYQAETLDNAPWRKDPQVMRHVQTLRIWADEVDTARTVLSQGASVEGDAVYLVATGEVVEGQETYTRHEGSPPPLCDSERLYSAAPASVAGLATEPVAWMTEDGRVASAQTKLCMPSASAVVFCIPLYDSPSVAEPAELTWISVEDRLPERAVPVLALVGKMGKNKPRQAVLEYWTPGVGHDDDEAGWFEASMQGSSDFVLPVTHWMPLPEPVAAASAKDRK